MAIDHGQSKWWRPLEQRSKQVDISASFLVVSYSNLMCLMIYSFSICSLIPRRIALVLLSLPIVKLVVVSFGAGRIQIYANDAL